MSLSKFGKDILINPDAPPGHPEAKWPDPDVGDDVLSDHRKYFDPQWMEREFEEFWPSVWMLAGRVLDLKSVGDYFEYSVGRESFIVARTDADTIQAYYNVCPHRGARIVQESFGNARNFVCRFHSWTWGLDGGLKRITDQETFPEAVICDNLDLMKVQCDTWGGFVFISMHPSPPPLLQFLDVVPEHLAPYRFEDMVIVAELSIEWHANWKVALDAFMEGYHIHMRHPEGLGYIDDYHCQRDMFANGHGRLIFPVGLNSPRVKDQGRVTDDLKEMIEDFGLKPEDFQGRAEDVREAMQRKKREWADNLKLDYDRFTDSQLSDDWNYFIFPNVTMNIHCDNALIMRFRPHPTDPDKCFYDVTVLAMPVNDPDYRLPRYMGAPPGLDLSKEIPRPDRICLKYGDVSLGLVLDQDADMVPFVQAGLKSRAFKGVRLGDQELRIRHFYAEYNRYMDGSKVHG